MRQDIVGGRHQACAWGLGPAILRVIGNLLLLVLFYDVFSGGVVNFKLGCGVLNRQAVLFDELDEMIALFLVDRNVASFCLEDHLVSILGFILACTQGEAEVFSKVRFLALIICFSFSLA